jgi:hypothetical protein
MHLRLREEDGGERARRHPAGALGGRDQLRLLHPVEQLGGEPLQVALAHAARRRQLVAVPGDAGGRQLVDVGEHELREARQLLRAESRLHRTGAHQPPRHAGAHPVGGEQRVHGAAAAGLAPPQLVGALQRRPDRRARVDAGTRRRELEEARQRQLDGVSDDLAHVPGELVGVARDLDDDLLDRRRGDRGQLAAYCGRNTGRDRARFDGHTSPSFCSRGTEPIGRFTSRAQVVMRWVGQPSMYDVHAPPPFPGGPATSRAA